MQKNFETDVLCIVGLGYVGLPLAIEFGKLRTTVGFDISKKRIQDLRNGIDETKECDQTLIATADQLEFTDDLKKIANCKIYIVTVPTPITDANQPDLEPLIEACKLLGSILNEGDCVIFESTVFPGATEDVCVPILEQISGLSGNEQFGYGYSPERINPGDKVNTLTKIKKIVSGSNKVVTEKICNLYSSIIDAGIWKAPSIKVAEAAKVIENAQRDLNIAFVNELSLICDLMGIDTLDVLEAAGSKWNFIPFRPGLVGGHCISVDPYYLTHKAEQLGYNPEVILAGRRINERMASHAATKTVKKMVENGIDIRNSKVAVLGITFKENCPDIRNTRVINMIRELRCWVKDVVVCDPWANPEVVKSSYNIELIGREKIKDVDALIVAVGHKDFRDLMPNELVQMCRSTSSIIADLKGLYQREKFHELGFNIFRL